MDPDTERYYRLNARDVAGRYEAVASPVARYFRLAFLEGGRVLDVGIGSGRDLAELLALGYDAYGTDPVAEMAAAAIARHPQLQGRITAQGLPALGQPFSAPFDGIAVQRGADAPARGGPVRRGVERWEPGFG